jgi:hypothetical protein
MFYMATTVTTDQPTTDHSPEVLDAFVADRQAFWGRFTRFVTFGATAIAVLLILLTIFLV